MRLIDDEASFNIVFETAQAYEKADASGNVDSLEVLHFESMEFLTRAFFKLLKVLLYRSNDDTGYYLTLDPDPVAHFAEFTTYPLVEIKSTDSDSDYLTTFAAEIGDSSVNALGTSWWRYVIMPKSNRWFILGTRDFSNDINGHIWCPSGWSEWIREEYPSAICK